MPELGPYFVTTKELAIIQAAHVVVVEWFQNPGRRSFRETILTRAETTLGQFDLAAGDYPAFRRVANLIRTGRGHPDTNPAPLIAGTRDHPDFVIAWDWQDDPAGAG
jgi:hypothetical protein